MIRRGMVVLLALMCVSLLASNGSQIGTVGARSTAMGSAFVGLADDWSALFFNPAGLTQLNGTTIGISYALITPDGTYKPNALKGPSFSGLSLQANALEDQTFHVPAISLFFQPAEKLTVGLGLFAPFGLGANFDLYDVPPGYQGEASTTLNGEKSYETGSDHEVVFVQPTVAYELMEGVSLGLGVGYTQRGKLELSEINAPLYSDLAGDPALDMLFDLLSASGVMNEDHRRIITQTELTGKGSSWNFNLGIHVDVNDWISVGASAKIYQDLKLEGTLTQTAHYPGLTDEAYTMDSTAIAQYVATAFTGSPDSLAYLALLQDGLLRAFPGVSGNSKSHAEANLPLPSSYSFGLALKPIKGLTLTLSETFTQWSAWDEVEIKLQRQSEFSSVAMHLGWEDTWETAVGAEYRVLDTDNLKLDIRGGFYMVASPVPDETMSPTLLDPNDRTVMTAGLGIGYGHLQLDIAYEMVTMGERNVSDYTWDEDLPSLNENYAGLYDMSANVLTFGLTFTR